MNTMSRKLLLTLCMVTSTTFVLAEPGAGSCKYYFLLFFFLICGKYIALVLDFDQSTLVVFYLISISFSLIVF